jgi:hypothetical protein
MLNVFGSGNVPSMEDARLAFLLGWEQVRTSRPITDILDDSDRMDELIAMMEEFSFSLPTALYYESGQQRDTTFQRYLTEVERLIGNLEANRASANQLSGQLNASIERRSALSAYQSKRSGVGYIAWFATFRPSTRIDALVRGKMDSTFRCTQ